MIDAKPDWIRRTHERLWSKYGVRPIGIDDQLERLFAARKSPREAVNAIGREFDLTALEAWTGDRP